MAFQRTFYTNLETIEACITKLLADGGRFQAARSITDPKSFMLSVITKSDSETVQKIIEAMNPSLYDDDYWASLGPSYEQEILAEERALTPEV